MILLLLALLQDPGAAILGRWEGTSTCVKVESNRACNDEIAMHQFVRDTRHAGVIIDHGYKKVGSGWEWMGDFELRYDSTGHRWAGEWSNGRVHVALDYRLRGTDLVGVMARLPEGQKGRDIALRRVAGP
jgi:hypothetical protein